MPEKSKIDLRLFNEPIQIETLREDFNFSYREKDYHVKPIADYELWGLVVSVNNINAWYNYYHDKNTVNLKDVCVIWGENINNEIYLDSNTKFKNGEWTCYFEWWSKSGNKIFPNKLSNSHLLTADPKIQEVIKDVNIGDQIYLKGSLVDYAETGTAWYRKTSVSRDDTNQTSRSGGACEILYVDQIDILKKSNPTWHLTSSLSFKLFVLLISAHIIFLLYSVLGAKKISKSDN